MLNFSSMIPDYEIFEPFQFNPLKHHLSSIREFILQESINENLEKGDLLRQLRHIGNSVMDIYTGQLSVNEVIDEMILFLSSEGLNTAQLFAAWNKKCQTDFRIIHLSDGSQWTLKHNSNKIRYVHFFPARFSSLTFRVKANTLKSAILYLILIGKDYITEEDMNIARALTGLSPLKEITEAEAITEMIGILRD